MERTRIAHALLVGLLVASLGGILGGMLTGCSGRSATSRLQSHFGLDDVSTPERIELGLQDKLPLGTPRARVIEFLRESRIGEDALSSVHTTDGLVSCRISRDKEDKDVSALVHEDYWISFTVDDEHGLSDIEVVKQLTGL